MEQKNQEQVQATVVNETPAENKKNWKNKAKKAVCYVLYTAATIGIGMAAGILGSKYGYFNKEQHSLAQAQKTFLDRKNGNV